MATGSTFEVLTLAEVIVSEWQYRCGVFSHMKLSGVPHLLRHSAVTNEDCRGMVRRELNIPEDRTVGLPLQMNTWNYFQLTASGNLEAYPSYLTCKGQETRHGEDLVENEVILLELRVRVRNEMFLIHQGHVESMTDHLQLTCTVREEGCQTSAKTYVWRNKEAPCNLHRVRSISPSHTRSTWLVDHRSQMLLNITGSFAAPGYDLTVRTTQLENIFVVEMAKTDIRVKVHQMPQLNVREVDMQRNTGMALDYLSYQLQRQIEATQQVAGVWIWKQH